MPTAQLTPSALGSGKDYVQLQMRIREDDNTLHIQGVGPYVNRDYGISADIDLDDLPDGVVDYLRNVPTHFASKAGTDMKYLIGQMRHAENAGRLNFQVKYDPVHNTKYGCTFNVDAGDYPSLATFFDMATGKIATPTPEQAVEEIED